MSENRIGDWIQTFKGNAFYPLDPRPEEIDIEDIAHSLSLICRYNGHCKQFYSVAEHSVLVSKHVSPEYALWGLLHDAAECYSADVPRPLKRNLQGWSEIEEKIMRAVCIRFGLGFEEPREVKIVDISITIDEKIAIMNPSKKSWNLTAAPIGAEIRCLNPWEAEREFLNRFDELFLGAERRG